MNTAMGRTSESAKHRKQMTELLPPPTSFAESEPKAIPLSNKILGSIDFAQKLALKLK
jgi:hypothetical protein